MSNMESLERQLAAQKKEHEAEIHSLEMKALLEKTRLEKEMQSHVAAMEAQVQHLVNQKIPETTRSALQQNAEFKAQMNQLSEQTQVLMGKNSALRDRKSRLSVDVDILEQMLSETSRQSCIRKKVVEQLTEKCQQLQAELKGCRQELEQLQTEHTRVLDEMEALRLDRASLSEQRSKNRAEAGRLGAELQEERSRRSRMKSIMREAAVTLRQALMDAATQQDSDVDSAALQWKQLMQKLLVVLDGPTLTKSTTETSDLAASRAGIMNSDLSFQFELARYRPGDLGFVPRPTLKDKRVLSRTGAGSSVTYMTLHRRPSSHKSAGSVNLKDSAIGLSKHK
ncbi:hypothetical protein L3Q82_006826 [Scortum barcoo]|uniref:Uncharacterized protein n=1 Tax=Scortum barcoo TaxID=214431 RepID=A0ACB8WV91_9TELE|nr:hypothetical protein L3Q82_006826 [Scortum barcoo]